MLSFTNSLSKKKEAFEPLVAGEVRMYHCGPTVYGDIHIGNLRSFLLTDLIRRVCELEKYTVTQVVNVTDLGHLSTDGDNGEDKMTRGLKREGMPITLDAMRELATRYMDQFIADMGALNIKRPHHIPRASDHIAEDIAFIQKLEAGGYTYATSDGLYFDTAKFPTYGELGGLRSDDADLQARVATSDEKKSPRDFALWKKSMTIGYESPWGLGFPGWHIECSAMSLKYLGEEFDIHSGGTDLAPVHHNNEIAQSVCATGTKFVRYWLHNAMVNIESGKMARSEGTGITLKTIIEKGFSPLAYRYWLLGGHYGTQMTFSWDALEQSQNAFDRLREAALELSETNKSEIRNSAKKYEEQLRHQYADDINTAEALATVWSFIKDSQLSDFEKRYLIDIADSVLGLNLLVKDDIPQKVLDIVNTREEARKNKDWQASDTLRADIETLGYTIKDTDRGPRIYKHTPRE